MKEKFKAFIKKNLIFIILLFILLVLFIIANLAKTKVEEKIPSPFPSLEKTEEIILDQKIEQKKNQLKEIERNFGKAENESQEENLTIKEYPSKRAYTPHKIYLKNESPYLIKKQVPFEDSQSLDEYLEKFPNSFTAFDNYLGQAYPLTVFLEEGLVVVAHISSKRIREIWYFLPITESDFFQTIGQDLTLSPPQQF
ncbi:hypothetical protein COT75_04365 [Candidatus Beckwithbacteria bacterium CG10_big_fil_rev_8_21_14_0_10_34_10]|uniref:Uncharacterized protein n=1 Tax=Candidatus Beckwithbacteria bacterium CG10_big_fil_rev_8_21_14_0_10_34_10 TaxID=1974495 RepID=A0A2H0W8A3_9BACT|nr:MAG: hypothetical protein COT75_04365 [Candidatus Beckwithbacteria bacterium CG10_big_fil_rev_8_21_14_0_10_34_10]